MKRWTLPVLLVLNLGLLAWLASMWLTPDGRLAGVHWQPPSALKPSLDGGLPLPATGVELGRYVATLERPLFMPSRRPPPPPQAAAAPVVVDTPPDVRVLGLYGTRGEGATGGMVARIDGQVKRVRVGDAVGRWTLKELRPGEAVLASGDSQQVYPLQRAAPGELASAPVTDNAAPAAAPSAPRPAALDPMRQRQIEDARANVRRINVLRARSGMPPVPEP
jgi:hypothetical protein